MEVVVNNENKKYQITIENGAIDRLKNYIGLDRKVLIITDSGVPTKYVETVRSQCKDCCTFTFEQGEKNKNLTTYTSALKFMSENNFTRSDLIIAIGGGVVGDLSGFVASSYMRGIEFINIPTTLLSQVDSSIGGKVAVDLDGIKNIVGAFYNPSAVVIDPTLLESLDKRQFSAGMAEIIKMACNFNKELFEYLEAVENVKENLAYVIEEALKIKKAVVEQDPKENGIRKVLNFGHTLGHAIETEQKGKLLHGECVAIGMLAFSSAPVRERLKAVLKKYGLPTSANVDEEEVLSLLAHDKKSSGKQITVIYSNEIGTYEMQSKSIYDLKNTASEYLKTCENN